MQDRNALDKNEWDGIGVMGEMLMKICEELGGGTAIDTADKSQTEDESVEELTGTTGGNPMQTNGDLPQEKLGTR